MTVAKLRELYDLCTCDNVNIDNSYSSGVDFPDFSEVKEAKAAGNLLAVNDNRFGRGSIKIFGIGHFGGYIDVCGVAYDMFYKIKRYDEYH